jgi:hypothetical protein
LIVADHGLADAAQQRWVVRAGHAPLSRLEDRRRECLFDRPERVGQISENNSETDFSVQSHCVSDWSPVADG